MHPKSKTLEQANFFPVTAEEDMGQKASQTPPTQSLKQGGVDLPSLLVAVVVSLVLFGVTLIPTHSYDSLKAVSLFTSMANTADSLNQLKVDTGSYPNRIAALWDKTQAVANSSFTGLVDTNAWRGPYIETQPVDATSGAMIYFLMGDEAQIAIDRETGGNFGFVYFLRASNITNAIIAEALKKCNGSDAVTVTFATGKCRATPGTGGTEIGTFDLKIGESR